MMNGKERMLAAFEEGSPDDIPSGTFYTTLAPIRGHFWEEIQGDMPWWMYNTLGTRNDPDFSKRLKVEKNLLGVFDHDWVWTWGLCASREWRRNQAIISTARGDFSVNVMPTKWGEPREYRRNVLLEKIPPYDYNRPSMDVTRPLIDMADLIQTKEDVEYYVNVKKAEELIEEGRLDWLEAVLKKFGDEYWIQISSSGAPFTRIDSLIGSATLLPMIVKKPKLLHQLLDAAARKSIEEIKAYSKVLAGREGLGVHCWEWYTGEVLSPDQWETLSKPYLQKMIKVAQQNGIKFTLSLTGAGMTWEEGIKRMLTMKPDSFHLEEEGMKGVRTDLAWQTEFLKREGYKKDIVLQGNVNTTSLLEFGSSVEVEEEVKRQIEIGREYGKFIMMLGVTISLETSLERVQEYCRLIRKYGRKK
jgi:uroporphyrinogen-III decarboxylase